MSDPRHDGLEDEEQGSPFDLKVLLLYGAARSRWIIIACILLGSAGGLFMAAGMPNVYKSKAYLQYKPGDLEQANADDAAGIDDRIMNVPGVLDEITLLDDLIVYTEVARELKPSFVLKTPDPTAGDSTGTPLKGVLMHSLQKYLIDLKSSDKPIRDDLESNVVKAAEHLRKHTEIGVQRNSYVLEVTHEAYTPEDARDSLEAVVVAFINRHNAYYSPASGDVKKRLDEAKEIWRDRQDKYNSHKDTICQIDDLGREKEVSQADRLNLIKSINGHEVTIAQLENKIPTLEKELAALDEFSVVVVQPEVLNEDWELANLEYQDAVRAITAIELGGTIALTSEKADLIKGWEKKRDSAKEKREGQKRMIPEGDPIETKTPNLAFAETQLQLSVARADLEGLRGEIEKEKSQLVEVNKILEKVRTCLADHSEFDSDIARLDEEIQQLSEQYQAELKMEFTREEGESNLKVMSQPTLPVEKSGPERMKLMVGGVGGGFLLGLFLAVLRQLLERRVRYKETLEKMLEVPVLAVVPEHRALRHLRPDGSSAA
tara:strand:- start:1497 stop:3134 length:1638 start_codon:yes stop_codon:yes gene_type:complete